MTLAVSVRIMLIGLPPWRIPGTPFRTPKMSMAPPELSSIWVLGRKPPLGDASMTTWIKCPKCRGEVGISDNSDTDVLCPRCREPLLLVDPETKTRWVPGKPPRSWRRPCGWILVSIAIFMMLYRFLREAGHRNPSLLVVLFEYVTDPFILVGMPLGIYWIRRGSSPTRANDRSIRTTDPDSLLVKPDGSSPTRVNDGSTLGSCELGLDVSLFA